MRATRGSVEFDIRVVPAAGVEEKPVEQRDMRCPICDGEMLFERGLVKDQHVAAKHEREESTKS